MPKGLAGKLADVPYRKLFLSRWSALLWAGGMMWTAIDIADASSPPPPVHADARATTTATGDPAIDNSMALLRNVISSD